MSKCRSFSDKATLESIWQRPRNEDYLLMVLQGIDPSIESMVWANKADNRKGIDCFVTHNGGYVTTVDFKFILDKSYPNWVILETLSNIEANKSGWAVKPTQAELFIIARVDLGLMRINDLLSIKASALIDLVTNHRNELMQAGGTLKQSHSKGFKGNRWSSEFIAIEPSKLVDLMGGDDLFRFDCQEVNSRRNKEDNEYTRNILRGNK